MDGKEITRKIKRSGHKVKDIADQLNVHSPFVSQVIHRVRPTKRVRQYIADLIGESVETLWPEEDKA